MASLYLHIPFCTRKCIYCDFYSIEGLNPLGSFLDALHAEIDLVVPPPGESVPTIFFGGGTPSLLPADDVRRILAHLADRFPIDDDAEITLESNPGTLTPAALRGFREAGVNRLSIGIQSFDRGELEFLGRIHDADEAKQAVRDAREAGFSNVSIDLIYALPGQQVERWQGTLEQGVALGPDHISAYSLIVEENTPLARMVKSGVVVPQPADEQAGFFDETVSVLSAYGYEQYEVSNFAKPGFRSRHNLNYWNHGNYLGFGPSAHSFLSDPATSTARRWWNIANVGNYSERLKQRVLPIAGEEQLAAGTMMIERLFLGLRSEGISLSRFSADFGPHLFDEKRPLIEAMIGRDLLTLSDDTLRLTPKGYLVCDEISARLTS